MLYVKIHIHHGTWGCSFEVFLTDCRKGGDSVETEIHGVVIPKIGTGKLLLVMSNQRRDVSELRIVDQDYRYLLLVTVK